MFKAFIIFILWCISVYYIAMYAMAIGWSAGIQCVERAEGDTAKIAYCKELSRAK